MADGWGTGKGDVEEERNQIMQKIFGDESGEEVVVEEEEEELAWPTVARGKRSRSSRRRSPSGSGSAATKGRWARGSPASPLDYSGGSGSGSAASTSGCEDGAFCSPPPPPPPVVTAAAATTPTAAPTPSPAKVRTPSRARVHPYLSLLFVPSPAQLALAVGLLRFPFLVWVFFDETTPPCQQREEDDGWMTSR